MTNELLNKIKTHDDLRKLEIKELPRLANEIRQLIKTSVSQQGGHLASNLGVVELTIAMHYVFDFASDRITWDVGHQCYPHKILTNRADNFQRLRTVDGISGFPSPKESPCDQFYVGHAGTAIASAIGLALGAQALKTDEKIVAVVGDASIVNGLSFEGLNNTHLLNRQMLIVMNDNFMAIDKTEGAFAQYLTRLRVSRPYGDLQRRTELMVRRLPVFGEKIQETLDRIKGGLKTTLLGRQPFEQLGIPAFGPIDGHDIPKMIKILTAIKEVNRPVLLHVRTDKGRGFEPASQDPCTFHSPSPFNLDGETACFDESPNKSFTAAFSQSLGKLMDSDTRIVAFTAAMPNGTGLAELREKFPKRIFDVGIAESAEVDIAAGMAKTGMIPVVTVYSTFMQRSFDQIFQEVSLQGLPVIFCIDRAGLVGGDGAVHHGFCDITLLRSLPEMILMAPIDDKELDQSLKFAVRSGKACAIRYPRDIIPPKNQYPDLEHPTPFELGKATRLREGTDATIFALGSLAYEALDAARILADENINVCVVSARFAKPLDEHLLTELLAEPNNAPLITLEDHGLTGGFGTAILEFAQENNLDARKIARLGMPDRFIQQDSRQNQLIEANMDCQSIVRTIRKMLKAAQESTDNCRAKPKKAPVS